MKIFKIVLSHMIFAQIAFAAPIKLDPSTIKVENTRPDLRQLVDQGSSPSASARTFLGDPAGTYPKSIAKDLQAMGPGTTGGGDSVSQEVRSLITSLPGVLYSVGTQYFPEINMYEFELVTKGSIYIELSEEIYINGAKKICMFDRAKNTIYVNAEEWAKLSASPNADVKKRALILHETLGLMGLEKNDDYTISNRLIGAEYLSMAGFKGTKDQILPREATDLQVIYWRISADQRIHFFYCQNRTMISTCTPLGTRGYKPEELDKAYRSLYSEAQAMQKKAKNYHYASVAAKTTTFVLIGAAVVWATVVSAGAFASLGPWVVGSAVTFVNGTVYVSARILEDQAKEMATQAQQLKQVAYLNSGTTTAVNFKSYAEGVQEFLIKIDGNDIAPENPVILNKN